MKNFRIKNIDGGVMDVDAASRRVKVAVSQVDNKDFDGDVIDKKAYDTTIRDRGPQGANLIWHLTDHYASLKSAVGKPKEVYMDGDKLVFVTDVPKTSWGNDVLEFYKTGTINQHSIGFNVIDEKRINPDTKDEYRLIKEVMLYEGSAVLWGANPNTPTLSVGKSLTKEEVHDEWKKTLDELGRMNKMFKTGSLTDQSYELIELKIAQLTERLQQLFTMSADTATEKNKPADPAVSSESNDLLEVLKTFSIKLKHSEDDGTRKSGKAA